MAPRFINWIWHVRGSLPLEPAQATAAFDRLDPLFRQPGTTHQRTAESLVFRKKDPVAQDRMAVFESGELRLASGASGPELRWHMTSRALLACFLAPLLFLAFAQLTVFTNTLRAPAAQSAPQKPAVVHPLHPIDKALGAPEPEAPKAGEETGRGKKPTPTAGYVFAGIFAVLYLVGRVLEPWLVRNLFARRLREA